MPSFVALVDYGRGNLHSVYRALQTVGIRVRVVRNQKEIVQAAALVVPGQGAFDDCMETLRQRDLLPAIQEEIRGGKPYLGICIGLQILYGVSEEHGTHPGLNVIPGRVVRFSESLKDEAGKKIKIPHMGWNEVKQVSIPAPFWKGIPDRSYFYFVHSFYGTPEDSNVVAGWTEYGVKFASSVYRDNLFAVQFHPEKSQKVGLILLKNFGAWVGKEVLTD